MKKITKENMYRLVRGFTPPVVFFAIKKSGVYPKMRKVTEKFFPSKDAPSWNAIKGGVLAGKQIFINPKGVWKDMLSGEYDNEVYDSIARHEYQGKVVFDIGSHIGYSALYFAELVGKNGKVIAFEPNTYNRQRFEKILEKNPELSQRIEIKSLAVSDKKGEEDFIFSTGVDSGTSSGSFIDSSHTFWEKSIYEKNIGFTRVKVNIDSIDNIISVNKIIPHIIKIDIEGAEYLAIEGAKNTLSKHKPILLVEIHSIFNMLKVYESLTSLNYNIHLVHEEKDGRCFIKATHK